MYCVYGNSGWYIRGGPLFGGGPLLRGSVIGGSTVYIIPSKSVHDGSSCFDLLCLNVLPPVNTVNVKQICIDTITG